MKCPIKNATVEELILFAEERNGCYAEYYYNKDLHNQLLSFTNQYQFDKQKKEHEYCLEIDKEYSKWRIKLK